MKRVLTKEELQFLFDNYPDLTNEELASRLNISLWTIKSRAYKHKLKKSPEYLSRQRHENAVRINSAARLNTKKALRKRIKTMKERYGNDKLRIRWGLEPVSKKREYSREPRERMLQRNYLRRIGYIVADGSVTAYYTPQTHRATRIERIPRGTKKGTIKNYFEYKPIEMAKRTIILKTKTKTKYVVDIPEGKSLEQHMKDEQISVVLSDNLKEELNEDLELLTSVIHVYKDMYRGSKDHILAVMELERKLTALTGGLYEPDTTYDIN